MSDFPGSALRPLHVSRAPEHGQVLSKSPLGCGPPYAIPRRSSSFAIRAGNVPKPSTTSQYEDGSTRKPRRDEILSSNMSSGEKKENCTNSTPRSYAKTSQGLIEFETHSTPEQKLSDSGIFSRLLHSLNPRPRDQNPVNKGDQSASLLDQLSTSFIPQFSKDISDTGTNSTSTSVDKGNIIPFTPDNTRRKPSRRRTPPLVRPTLQIPRSRRKTGARFLQSIPITTANLELLADIQDIDIQSDVPLWLTVEVTAAVGIDQGLGDGIQSPLDVVIVVDNLKTTSTASLKDVYDNAFLVAAETTNKNDCVAICAIYNHNEAGLVSFLPLAMYDIDTIKRVFDYIPHLEPPVDRTRQSEVKRALKEASDMLMQLSNRGALCHVFLVTADSTLDLPRHPSQDRVQLHTVSPEPIFGPRTWTELSGFHLAYGIYFGDSPIAKQAQIQKIELLFKQLRTGYYPGALSDLVLNLIPGDGYAIESILGDTTYKSLRPGEKWSVIIKIRDRRCSNAQNIGYNSNRVDALMDELFEMLGVSSAYKETILSACLEYRHSCLPNAATVKIERNWDAPQPTQSDVSHFGFWGMDVCGSFIVENSRGYQKFSGQDRASEQEDYQDPLDEEINNRTLEHGSPCASDEHKTGLGTESSEIPPQNTPHNPNLASEISSNPCEILGDATNKGRPKGRERNHRAVKPLGGSVDSDVLTPENRKPKEKKHEKPAARLLDMEEEGIPDMAQHEWHDIGWC